MRWLTHGNVTVAAVDALVRHGHRAQQHNEQVEPVELLKHAHQNQLDLITTDAALVNASLESQASFGRSIVFLQLKGGEVEQDDAIDRLFARYKRLTPGRLYTVTESRVKIRQLPGDA